MTKTLAAGIFRVVNPFSSVGIVARIQARTLSRVSAIGRHAKVEVPKQIADRWQSVLIHNKAGLISPHRFDLSPKRIVNLDLVTVPFEKSKVEFVAELVANELTTEAKAGCKSSAKMLKLADEMLAGEKDSFHFVGLPEKLDSEQMSLLPSILEQGERTADIANFDTVAESIPSLLFLCGFAHNCGFTVYDPKKTYIAVSEVFQAIGDDVQDPHKDNVPDVGERTDVARPEMSAISMIAATANGSVTTYKFDANAIYELLSSEARDILLRPIFCFSMYREDFAKNIMQSGEVKTFPIFRVNKSGNMSVIFDVAAFANGLLFSLSDDKKVADAMSELSNLLINMRLQKAGVAVSLKSGESFTLRHDSEGEGDSLHARDGKDPSRSVIGILHGQLDTDSKEKLSQTRK